MPEEQIDLRDLAEQLLRKRWQISMVVVICAGMATLVGLLQPKIYDAAVVLVSAPDQSGSLTGSGMSLGSRLGGLATLTGLGASGSGKEAESIAVLESAALTRRYIEENDLLPVLFEPSWNPATKDWKTAGSEKVPSLWLGSQYFIDEVRSVERASGTGLVTLTVRWKDPAAAASWANGMVALANRYLRDKAIGEAERNIAYLTDQAQKTNIVEAKQAIFSLLEGELNKAMLARGSEEYAFRVIDPATAPESPSTPGWKILLLAGIVAGALLGIFLALVQLAWKRPTSNAA